MRGGRHGRLFDSCIVLGGYTYVGMQRLGQSEWWPGWLLGLWRRVVLCVPTDVSKFELISKTAAAAASQGGCCPWAETDGWIFIYLFQASGAIGSNDIEGDMLCAAGDSIEALRWCSARSGRSGRMMQDGIRLDVIMVVKVKRSCFEKHPRPGVETEIYPTLSRSK